MVGKSTLIKLRTDLVKPTIAVANPVPSNIPIPVIPVTIAPIFVVSKDNTFSIKSFRMS